MHILTKSSGQQPTRNETFVENKWVGPHSNRKFYPERVGSSPLETPYLTKRVGQDPPEIHILQKSSGYTPFAKFHTMLNNRDKSTFFIFYRQFWSHSKELLFEERVGSSPLETPHLVKTSGARPTWNAHFDKIEWAVAHSKRDFCWKRVGRAPLEIASLPKTSGNKFINIPHHKRTVSKIVV